MFSSGSACLRRRQKNKALQPVRKSPTHIRAIRARQVNRTVTQLPQGLVAPYQSDIRQIIWLSSSSTHGVIDGSCRSATRASSHTQSTSPVDPCRTTARRRGGRPDAAERPFTVKRVSRVTSSRPLARSQLDAPFTDAPRNRRRLYVQVSPAGLTASFRQAWPSRS